MKIEMTKEKHEVKVVPAEYTSEFIGDWLEELIRQSKTSQIKTVERFYDMDGERFEIVITMDNGQMFSIYPQYEGGLIG